MMASIIRKTFQIQPLRLAVRAMSGGQASGDGAVGGAGGSIKEKKKDGSKKVEAAQEDQYFRKLQAAQLKALKKDIDSEVKHHEDSIKHMEESIEFHKKRVDKLNAAKKAGHDSD